VVELSERLRSSTYVQVMKEVTLPQTSMLIRNAVAATLVVLCSPGAALAFTPACSLLPRLADWAFETAYVACGAVLLGIAILRLTGRLRPRHLLYPLWAALLIFLVDFVADYVWLDQSRLDQVSCYAP